MKILLLGSKGQLGRCLSEYLIQTEFDVTLTSRNEIDITDLEDTRNKIIELNPDVVINTSAYTAVEAAEENLMLAQLINHHAVATIADACLKTDCCLIHLSTDYVFDGASKAPYNEEDKTNPLGVYGRTKLAGEKVIQQSGCKYFILRTSWLFGGFGDNFLTKMVKLGECRNQIDVVSDQFGCPTYSNDLSEAILKLLPECNSDAYGVYNYSSGKIYSWFSFAQEIFSVMSEFGLRTPAVVKPVSSSELNARVRRPCYSVLDNTKFESQFGSVGSGVSFGIRQSIANFCDA